MTSERKAVFLDTNLFLHYRAMNEIDWCSLLDATTVELKIAPVVTKELEERKTLHQSKKIRERAAKALRLLHGYLSKPHVREGVTLEFLINEETTESAKIRGLNLQLGDDRLIGTIFLYREEHPQIPCVLITSDLPLTVKAKHYGVEQLALSVAYQLPEEPDPSEKKIKHLESELLKYRSREPFLDLTFDNGKPHIRFQISNTSSNKVDSEAETKIKVDAIKQKYPLIDLTPQQEAHFPSANTPFTQLVAQIQEASVGFDKLRRQVREDYNKRIRSYHLAYERYLRDALGFTALNERTLKLNIVLHNTGTSPADDIHVLLHFPNGFTLYDENHMPEYPKEPETPSTELDLFPATTLFSLPDIYSFSNIQPRLPTPRNPNLPTIKKTNSYDVTFERKKLNHGFVSRFDALYVAFDSSESVRSFSIEYVVRAANVIEEKRGELSVVVETS